MTKVNPAGMAAWRKDLWLEALRSGEYVQGKEALSSDTNVDGVHPYCCLGILCEVSPDIDLMRNDNGDAYVEEIKNQPDFGGLTQKMLPMVGLTSSEQVLLANMNDGSGHFEDDPRTFTEIADWIEQHVPVREGE